ncbi:hypothetical protein [Reinekea sp. G2M2-21]|uniref:hypothetical protein n=1 Tax=Reinekea sp. G2M2-21 TaxID=2788942 RepID=UPI0018A8AE97|nr:hypothetical protein [Reinekea sp. G2M2-21]
MLFPVLKDTLTFYWQNLKLLAAIMLPLVIPLELFNMVLGLTWTADENNVPQLVASIMAQLIVYPIYQTALVLAVADRLVGKTPDIKQLWAQGANLWFMIVLANVLFYVGVFTGLILLIIPGIFLMIRWSLVEQNIVLNQENPLEALRSSWKDTSDHFWLILFGGLILGIGVLLITTPISTFISNLSDGSPVAMFFPSVLQSLTYPLFVVFLMRVRHYIRHKE